MGFSYTVTPRSRRPTIAKPRRSQKIFASVFSSTTDSRSARYPARASADSTAAVVYLP